MKKTILSLAVFAAASCGVQGAVTLSSHSRFDSDTDGWQEGGASPNPPSQTANPSWDGNPGYLINTSTGSGVAGSRFVMFHLGSDWTGDYLGAGVSAISIYVDNWSGAGSTLPLAIAFNGPGGWFLSDPVGVTDVTPGVAEWQRVQFDLSVANFTRASGNGTLADTLGDVSRFEILLEDGAGVSVSRNNIRGERLAADLRFDDIRAVPEPSNLGLILLGGLISLGRRKRSRAVAAHRGGPRESFYFS
ncbi:MAG: PEP-CTERM sorting domain-containing protein [Akkermansiaceae bacterium]